MTVSPSPVEIVVFDFDGTITTDDTFRLFLRYYAGVAKWALNILLLLPVFVGYALKIVDRNQAKIYVIRRFFKNAPVERLNARAASFAEEIIPSLIRPQAQSCLDDKKSDLESLYICSASIAPYLRAWGESQNIHNILATELETDGNRYTGEIKGWNIWGEGKVRRILAEFAPHPVKIIEAYGDSRGDREMLHAAEASYFRPFRL
ncbi:HAD-IB family phosphatase [Hellea balneolensis]|uniref:HAD-IB family phosphatase n=1 Tax=Hellea balneolensis TaxID=287478 RepID=UPI000403E1E1|nr:HAD-IB family phosphatase [Hellea balneolensis]